MLYLEDYGYLLTYKMVQHTFRICWDSKNGTFVILLQKFIRSYTLFWFKFIIL